MLISQKLFPVIFSIVVCGVIALLFAADKRVKESSLLWIVSGNSQAENAG